MPALTNEVRLIFVGGSPRSGTTLVQNILDCHPQIYGGPEFLHIPDIIGLRSKLRSSVDRGWIESICTHHDVDEKIRGLIESFLLPLAHRHSTRFLSEKTPENVLVFSELAELFPQARFIHVVRDPRAVVASMLQVGQRAKNKKLKVAPFTRNTSEAIRFLRQCLESGFNAERTYPERIFTVVYERLVSEAEEQTRRLCTFLEIDWNPAMVSPGDQDHAGASAITVQSDELWYDRKTYYSNPHKTSVQKWRGILSPSQQVAVIKTFRGNNDLRRLGYDLGSSDLSVTNRVSGELANAASGLTQRLLRKFGRVMRRLNPGLS